MQVRETLPVGTSSTASVSSTPNSQTTGSNNSAITAAPSSPPNYRFLTTLRIPLESGFSKALSEDIHFLGDTLGEIIKEHAGVKIFDTVESLRSLARQVRIAQNDDNVQMTGVIGSLSTQESADILKAFTDYFYLVNEVEKGEIIRVNREREKTATHETPRKESIAHAIYLLKEKGYTASEVQNFLNNLRIQPVFTAHPTEAKRQDLIDLLDKIMNLTHTRKQDNLTQTEQDEIEADVKRSVTLIWHTPKNRQEKPTPIEEVENSLPFMDTAYAVIPRLYADLNRALIAYYPGSDFNIPQIIKFGTWIGGDRDGNPYVTPAVTKQAVKIYAKSIITKYIDRIETLRHELSIHNNASRGLTESIEKDRGQVRLESALLKRHANEPYRIKLSYIHKKLQNTLSRINGNSRAGTCYNNAGEFLNDLNLISSSLNEARLTALAEMKPLKDLIFQVKTFGFSLAELDVREHSEVHENAVSEILSLSKVAEKPYEELSENEKVEMLTKLLSNDTETKIESTMFSPETKKTLEVFNSIKECQNIAGVEAVRPYIISFTQDVSDVLEVLFLGKESGLIQVQKSGAAIKISSTLDIVPLFETVNDLRNASKLLEKLFNNDFYKAYLSERNNFQEIMLGYSDSSKDGGYLAANIELHKAQKEIAEVCNKNGVKFRFFHGRGGSIGRGGGTAVKAIQALPKGAVNGNLRLTEQGEVISARYSNPDIAHRQLESIIHSVLVADLNKNSDIEESWVKLAEILGEAARLKYRDLVYDDPEFWNFYTQATPVNFISKLKIASRPSKRKGLEKIEDLRAIPWIFSWTQTRMMLPTWYGIGTAFSNAAKQDGGIDCLKDMYQNWSFFRTIIDNCQIALAKADMQTAWSYMRLVEPKELGERIFTKIIDEFTLTRKMLLEVTGQNEILDNNPVIQSSIRLRNPYTDPLNYIQVELLNRLKQEAPNTENNELTDAILLSINGVAAAMQETG